MLRGEQRGGGGGGGGGGGENEVIGSARTAGLYVEAACSVCLCLCLCPSLCTAQKDDCYKMIHARIVTERESVNLERSTCARLFSANY